MLKVPRLEKTGPKLGSAKFTVRSGMALLMIYAAFLLFFTTGTSWIWCHSRVVLSWAPVPLVLQYTHMHRNTQKYTYAHNIHTCIQRDQFKIHLKGFNEVHFRLHTICKWVFGPYLLRVLTKERNCLVALIKSQAGYEGAPVMPTAQVQLTRTNTVLAPPSTWQGRA